MRCTLPLLASSLLLLSGCAFEVGRPFGQADLSLSAVFDPGADRLDDQGRLKTSSSFAVALDRFEVGFGRVRLLMQGAMAEAFDPANPPPRYSLCHNGHCHRDDGALIDYEDIAIELAGGADRPPAAQRTADPAPVAVDATVAPVTLSACANDCILERGDLSSVQVELTSVLISGRVFDLSSQSRLTTPGQTFTATVGAVNLRRVIEGRIDDGEPLGIKLPVVVRLPSTILDGVDLSATAPIARQIAENLTQTDVAVSVTRFD